MLGMPSRPSTIPAAQPLDRRLAAALLFPLRGAALAALAGLVLAHALTDLLPGILGLAGDLVVWASILMYAMQCLRRTADGHAGAPEVSLYSNYGPALSMLLLQALAFISLVLAIKGVPGAWLVVLGVVLMLPVIAMSLAFEDHLLAALHPLRWGTVLAAFGPAYLVPVAVGSAEYLAYIGYLRHDGWLGRSLWFAAVAYLCLLQFHLVGALMHRHHEKLGHTPEADTLADASGRDADAHLLQQARSLSGRGEHQAAEALLRDRLRERHPPLHVFAAHRALLHRRDDRDALLAWAHTHLNRMLDEDQLRPALGLVGECIELDPDFMPEYPALAGRLAEAAADQGMTRLALKLARGYPNTWPRDPKAPDYGLLAARLLAERMRQTAEAGVLAAKLLRAYPDHPARPRIEQFLHGLDMHPDGHGEASA